MIPLKPHPINRPEIFLFYQIPTFFSPIIYRLFSALSRMEFYGIKPERGILSEKEFPHETEDPI
jgi:hypothetical protein